MIILSLNIAEDFEIGIEEEAIPILKSSAVGIRFEIIITVWCIRTVTQVCRSCKKDLFGNMAIVIFRRSLFLQQFI